MANFRLRVIAESLKPQKKGSMIEFNKYRETHEPYVYKSDITTGAGWFIILTRNDLPKKTVASDIPPLPPTPPTGGRNKNKTNKMNKSNRQNKRTKKNRKLKMSKKNKRKPIR